MGKKDNVDLRLLIELANMYYNEGATQQEIANKFHISRSLVSKYLIKARENGAVEIIIHDELINPYYELENSLSDIFDIDEVICVLHDENDLILKKRLGLAGAKYLTRVIKANQSVGISTGSTLLEIGRNLSPNTRFVDNTFVPLVGGLGKVEYEVHAHMITEMIARKTHAKYLEFYAPVILDNASSKAVFLNQPFIASVLDAAKKVDIAIVGVGVHPSKNKITKYYFDIFDFSHEYEFLMQEAVSDMGYIFVNKEGKEIKCDWNNRILGLNLNDLKSIDTTVVIAGGDDKYHGIKAACNSQVVNVLITDDKTASRIKEEVVG